MLETKNLTKIYRPKKGVPVCALNKVSLKFPDKGMVFLIGKSGSGKSTLLNVLGGLDKYDGGEIIIKGKSSKDFKQKDFDSYRNTYVGFIFQEYNVLEEFTVGANIALALELQGKKVTDEAINKILADVDLAGYGARRPNELSGGQKQRVAIARALVKSPKIIMADEPSGALDSITGKQVFETLKKLSKEKLVIVVSHDHDFAFEYGDRIIQLADGNVVSDTSLADDIPAEIEVEPQTEEIVQPQGITFNGTTASIPVSYRLTEEDRIAINEYLEKIQNNVELEFTNPEAATVKPKKVFNRFKPTVPEQIVWQDNSPFSLIKSKLSLKNAFKIGSGGLKYKKFRLVMTVLLSSIAFTLFGLANTFASYNHIDATANSIMDINVEYATLTKTKKEGSGIFAVTSSQKFSDEDIAALKEELGVDFKGIYSEGYGSYFSHHLGSLDVDDEESSGGRFDNAATSFRGIVEVGMQDLESMGYEIIAGNLPDGSKNEIMISKFVADGFIKKGYKEYDVNDYYKDSESNGIKINGYNDMLGKTLVISSVEYKVVGVVDTKVDEERYSKFNDTDDLGITDMILSFVLSLEFEADYDNSYTGMMMVGEGFLENYNEDRANAVTTDNVRFYFSKSDGSGFFPQYVSKYSDVDPNAITWLDKNNTSLDGKEIVITTHVLEMYIGGLIIDEFGNWEMDESLIEGNYTLNYYDYYDMAGEMIEENGYKIIGIIDTHSGGKYSNIPELTVISDETFDRYFEHDGVYSSVIGTMPDNKNDIKNIAKFCSENYDGVEYALNNPVSFEIEIFNGILEVVAGIFMWVGVFFAIFASLLLSNFIAVSVSNKKQEIGILRALGARSNDVFRIFFAEAFIIAMINFVLALVGTASVTIAINLAILALGVLITPLNFGILQILLLFAVSTGIAFVASFIPVKKIASKRPIDAIRNR